MMGEEVDEMLMMMKDVVEEEDVDEMLKLCPIDN